MEPLLMGRSQLRQQQQKERYIDLIDAKKKELVWGQGGYLTQNREQKEKLINEFVAKILAQFHQNLNNQYYLLY
jgi:hypothetical protein